MPMLYVGKQHIPYKPFGLFVYFLNVIPCQFKGEPCEVCPVLPKDSRETTVLQGKPGPKGEPGTPGKRDQGLPVSSFLLIKNLNVSLRAFIQTDHLVISRKSRCLF